MHHSFIERLNPLQQRFSFFPCFIGLFPFLFNLAFELSRVLRSFSILSEIGSATATAGQRQTQQPPDHDSDSEPTANTSCLASPKRRSDTKLPANPSPIPTAISARHTERGKKAMRLSIPLNRPVD